jgi:hypothetical protein
VYLDADASGTLTARDAVLDTGVTKVNFSSSAVSELKVVLTTFTNIKDAQILGYNRNKNRLALVESSYSDSHCRTFQRKNYWKSAELRIIVNLESAPFHIKKTR